MNLTALTTKSPWLKACLFCALMVGAVTNDAAGGAAQAPPLELKDLTRLAPDRLVRFPWERSGEKARVGMVKPAEDPDSSLKISAHDLVVQGFGVLNLPAPDPTQPGKIKLDLKTKDFSDPRKRVVIESAGSNFVLRGYSIRALQDGQTGNLESVTAHGEVEFVLNELSAKGKEFFYEIVITSEGKKKKEIVTILGDRDRQKPATLWSGDNKIQSYKFVLDLRLNTYRAQGGAIAEVHLPDTGQPAPQAQADSSLPLPSLDLSASGTLEFSCDGDLLLDGPSGTVKILQNVYIKKGPLTIHADEVTIRMVNTEGTGPADPGSLFGGSFQSLDCLGRVVIDTDNFVIHCDGIYSDLSREIVRLEMDSPKDEVRMYRRMADKPTHALMYLHARHRFSLNPITKAIVDHMDEDNTNPTATMGTHSMGNKPMEIPIKRPDGLPRLKQLNLSK